MAVFLIGHQSDAVGVEQHLGRIAQGHIIAGLHLIGVVQRERSLDHLGVVYCRVECASGFLQFLQSNQGSRPCQIAGIIALSDLRFLLLTDSVIEELAPLIRHPQFLVVRLVVVEGLGHPVVDVAERRDVALVLYQFVIVLQGFDGGLRLLHIQIDHANLLVGHRPPQFIIILRGVCQHVLQFLEGQLQLALHTEDVGLLLPGAVVVVPLSVLVEPLHLGIGLGQQPVGLRGTVQQFNLSPAGLAFLVDVASLLFSGYLPVYHGEGGVRLVLRQKHKAPRQDDYG